MAKGIILPPNIVCSEKFPKNSDKKSEENIFFLGEPDLYVYK